MPHIVLVAVGGVLGANARYLLSHLAARRYGAAFPYNTLAINPSGSFLLTLNYMAGILAGGITLAAAGVALARRIRSS